MLQDNLYIKRRRKRHAHFVCIVFLFKSNILMRSQENIFKIISMSKDKRKNKIISWLTNCIYTTLTPSLTFYTYVVVTRYLIRIAFYFHKNINFQQEIQPSHVDNPFKDVILVLHTWITIISYNRLILKIVFSSHDLACHNDKVIFKVKDHRHNFRWQ